MKKVFLVAAVAWISVGVAVSAGWYAPQTSGAVLQQAAQSAAPAARAAQAPTAAPAARPVQSAPAARATAPAEYKELVNKYCVTCHNQRANIPAGAPLHLDAANLDNPTADAMVWEKVVRRLGIGAMPPQGMPSPGEAKLAEFRTWLTTTLDRAALAQRNPGRFVLHRLNRTEYANAIRDLLSLDIDAASLLPSDGGEFGFDNVASALTTSPLLLERYLTAALRISALAVGDTEAAPGASAYPISLEVSQNAHVEGLPPGTRGGRLVRHIFPADGEYELSAQLNRTILNGYSGVEGHETPHELVITIDDRRVFSTTVGGPDDHKLSADDPNKAGAVLDARLRGKVFVTAGPHDVGFTWIDRPTKDQSVWTRPQRDTQEVHHAGGLPRLKTVTIEGPYFVTGISDTISRDRIFVCRPSAPADEAPCAQRIVSSLSRRAFRRPVTVVDTEAPMTFYTQARRNGGNFDAGIRAALARILASPSFLFRSERDPEIIRAGAAHQVTDLELASRLSFFLWSSIPDDQLLNLAVAGRLRAPGVLEAQVRRMLADKRSDALMTNFPGQWLQLRNLESVVSPDLLLFPDFDDNVRKAFRRETELLFATAVRENLSALDLLRADFTFVNERLAKHYGIPNVYGTRFRRVQLTDPNRRGLLGHGSILSLTSVANRTSPVIRGKYVMSTLLNTPPLPPPPNVPPLEASASKEKPTTVRQQLELHRANAVCASCHRNIDPVGFALENFNSVGQWRETTKEGLKVDTDGVLVDGRKIDGPIQLREALLSRPEIFVGTVTENLMVYALGRGLDPADQSIVRNIVKTAAPDDYRFNSIIMGIVKSAPFQMRTKLAQPVTDSRIANNRVE